jgi:hypothetical protein
VILLNAARHYSALLSFSKAHVQKNAAGQLQRFNYLLLFIAAKESGAGR